MSTAKTLAKGTAWILISALIIKFLAFIYYIILARTVPQEEIGQFFFVLSVVGIISLFSDLGLGSSAIGRFVPFYAGQEKFNYVKKVLKISVSAGTIFSTICAIFLILFADNISNFFSKPYLTSLFQIMASYFLIINFYYVALNFLQGRKLMKFVSYIQSIQQIFKTVLTIIFLFFFGFVAESIAFGFVLSFLFAAVFGWLWVLKEHRTLPKTNEEAKFISLLKQMVPFGLTVVLISSMGIINGYTDRIMLGYFFPAAESDIMIGIYTIAIAFPSIIGIFAGAIGSIFYPVITEMWAKKNTEEMQKTTTTVIRWIFISSIPMLLITLIFPVQILTIVYGENYAEGWIVVILASTGLFIIYLSLPSQYILAAMNRLDITKKIIAVGAITNVLLNFIFIPIYDINGAAFASLISAIIMTTLFLRTSKTTNIKFPKDIYKPVAAGILAAVILYLLATLFNFDEILINFVSQSITAKDTFSEILLKFLKVFVLGIFVLIAFSVYLIFLIKFKAFHKEDVEILAGGMRRAKIPEKYISFVQRILLKP
ncbi:MAG: hypothetical protein CVT88_06765 [Candidatus Altiarchaeales archaeon HGW-Altiarchaeales-1]|nr:MAG: hypothetical protein CVT88_06765 [Candidatus Altiarchaeales archaeon HGW-Altiarchaeales-1]